MTSGRSTRLEALVLAGERLSGPDEQDRRDDGEHHTPEVQLEDAARADQRGEDAADDRADHPQAERGQDAEVLPAGLEEACDPSDDEAPDQKSDEIEHDVSSRGLG